jgi:hypothetical protein
VPCSVAPRGKGGARQCGPMYVREKRKNRERNEKIMSKKTLEQRGGLFCLPARLSSARVVILTFLLPF